MPVRARRRYQGGNALYQFQRGEVQFVDLGATLVVGGLALLFGTAVDQGSALFAKALHGKWRAGAVAQQPLQGCPVVCLDADTGIHRETAVLV